MKCALLISSILIGALAAQFMGDIMPGRGPSPKVMERIETLKMWKLTEALDLSQEQAVVVFPLLNSFRLAEDSLRERQMILVRELGEVLQSGTDSIEILGIIDELKAAQKTECDIKIELFDELPKILSAEQQAKYVLFEIEFRKKMMELIREFHKGERPHGEFENRKWK